MDARVAREIASLFRSDAFFFSYELGIENIIIYIIIIIITIIEYSINLFIRNHNISTTKK